jgi:CRP/FNR family transcriptional regulator, anaerobic regulatory protein
MTDNILQQIKLFVKINEEEENAFLKILETIHLKKKEYIFEEGKICNSIYFVNKGCLRLFQNIDGVENTLDFFFENHWYSDFQSALLRKPSDENVQAIENSEVIKIDIMQLENLYLSYPIFERMGRLLVTHILLSFITLRKEISKENPKERYVRILKEQPEIIQKIPLQFIASFLGIQKESLSRIRKKYLHGF